MSLFNLLAMALVRNERVELRPIKHLTSDLRRPRDAKRYALKRKAIEESTTRRTYLRRQAE